MEFGQQLDAALASDVARANTCILLIGHTRSLHRTYANISCYLIDINRGARLEVHLFTWDVQGRSDPRETGHVDLYHVSRPAASMAKWARESLKEPVSRCAYHCPSFSSRKV